MPCPYNDIEWAYDSQLPSKNLGWRYKQIDMLRYDPINAHQNMLNSWLRSKTLGKHKLQYIGDKSILLRS